MCRPAVFETARQMDKKVKEPSVQNHYPDYTLLTSGENNSEIAIDIKTTYRNKDTDKFNFTLGGYTSFMRKGNETKNIVYPFNEHAEHWIIGFVYNRIAEKKLAEAHSYDYNEIEPFHYLLIMSKFLFKKNDKYPVTKLAVAILLTLAALMGF